MSNSERRDLPRPGFLRPLVSTVIAGLLLAVIFFVWRAFIFPVPTVGGAWYCLTVPAFTTFSAYEGQFLGWRVVLAQSDGGIGGSSEKIWEGRGLTGAGRNRMLESSEIDRGEIEGGSLQYRYFSASELSLHAVIAPVGNVRTSTWYLDLQVGDREWPVFRRTQPQTLRGRYYWTAADQRGDVLCRRERVQWSSRETLEAFQASLLASVDQQTIIGWLRAVETRDAPASATEETMSWVQARWEATPYRMFQKLRDVIRADFDAFKALAGDGQTRRDMFHWDASDSKVAFGIVDKADASEFSTIRFALDRTKGIIGIEWWQIPPHNDGTRVRRWLAHPVLDGRAVPMLSVSPQDEVNPFHATLDALSRRTLLDFLAGWE